MDVESLVETGLAIVLPGFFAPLLATDDKMEQVFPRPRPATCVWFEFSLVLWIPCLSVIGQSEKALFRSNEKKIQLPFLFSVPDVQCPFIVFILTQAPESPVPLQTYSTTFQSVTVPGTSGTAVLKKMFILIRPLCSLTSKGSFPSHPQGQLSAAAILLPCFCPFIHSFLCRQQPLDCVPVSKKTFPQGTF